MKIYRSLSPVFVAVALAGCVAAHEWQPGPQIAADANFERDQAQCSMVARHSGEGGFVLGPPAFIIGAAIGSAIREHNRAQADYNDCLVLAGWRAAP